MLYFKLYTVYFTQSHIHIVFVMYLGEPLQCIHCPEIIYLKREFSPLGFALTSINLSNSSDHHLCVKKQLHKEYNYYNTIPIPKMSLSRCSLICLRLKPPSLPLFCFNISSFFVYC